MPRSRHVRAYLASITALSGSAIAAAGSAGAAPVYIPVNAKVGYGPRFGSDATIRLTKSQTINVKIRSSFAGYNTRRITTTPGHRQRVERSLFHPVTFAGVNFAHAFTFLVSTVGVPGLRVFPKGATTQAGFSTGSFPGGEAEIFAARLQSISALPATIFVTNDYPGKFSKQYALFTFTDTTTDQLDYGWLELSAQMGRSGGPNVTIIAAAYDPSGNPLPAGEGVPKRAAIPEPSSLPLEFSGLAALALGATGVRRWRSARAKAAAA